MKNAHSPNSGQASGGLSVFSTVLRRKAGNLLSLVLPVSAYVLSVLIIWEFNTLMRNGHELVVFCALPMLMVVAMVGFLGLVSKTVQDGIVPGKFPRDAGHKVYFKRKIYGACWTTLYYCKPLYFLVLHMAPLKRLTFRLFGYKGPMDFTVYPDTWIRDLSLLDLGHGVYLSNRCTIGTNICHMNNTISVGRITIGAQTIIGHLAKVAHGAVIGHHSEIGVGCGVGINTTIGDHVLVGPMTVVNHYATIGHHVRIGAHCYIGAGAKIGAGAVIPPGTVVEDRAVVEGNNKATSNDNL